MKKGHAHCEVPLMASTSMDWFLSKEVSGKAVQARRLRVRDVLGLAGNAYLKRHSLGHYGSFQLEASSVLMCLLTEVRWQGAYTQMVGDSFAAAGLPALVRSDPFVELTKATAHAVRFSVGEGLVAGTKLPVVVNRAICGLMDEDLFHRVALDYSGIVQGVVEALAAVEQCNVERYVGQVVWIDERDALVSLDLGEDEEETRVVDSEYLAGMGIDTDGQPIVAIDQQWSPDAGRITYYQPAVLVSGEDLAEAERWERILREAETPPPRDRGEAVNAA